MSGSERSTGTAPLGPGRWGRAAEAERPPGRRRAAVQGVPA
ncbi:hypothetical protein [Streptomyces sp. NRRL B-1347]|nr:hypothetical protein [Streptomyces sp. NRRL B-1347]